MNLANMFFSKKLAPVMDRLHSRWLDENEYEDWREYEKVIVKIFSLEGDNITLAKIEKTPFRVHFSVDGVRYVAKCGARKIELIEVAIPIRMA